jgi:hypothetical protein
MKIAGLMLFLLAVAGVPAQSEEPPWKVCRYPVRVLNGNARVDLTPLFKWWEHQPQVISNRATQSGANNLDVDRPLTAWHRVAGNKVGMIGSSWVLDAFVFTSPTSSTNERIILNHPPGVEEQAYDALLARIEEAKLEIANARQTYESNTNEEAQARERAIAYRESHTKVASDGYRDYSALAVEKHEAATVARGQMDQLEAIRKEAEAQLKTIPHGNGQFLVDWFAVLEGHTKQGVPVYDLGLISTSPP